MSALPPCCASVALFVFVGVFDDRRLALVIRFGVAVFVFVIIGGNRHEHPRRQSLASAGVADRHPILTHGLEGRRDIAVGVAQELLGLAGLVCRSEQRTALIVFTVNQDG